MLKLIFSGIFSFLLAVISGGLAEDFKGTGIGDFLFAVATFSMIVTVFLFLFFVKEVEKIEQAKRIEQARKMEEERKRKQRRYFSFTSILIFFIILHICLRFVYTTF